MERFVHTLSAYCFYILGSTFFVAYILARNGIAEVGMMRWLQIGDMPLLFAGLLYGGLSIHRSMQGDAGNASRLLILGITFPALAIFAAIAFMNFAS